MHNTDNLTCDLDQFQGERLTLLRDASKAISVLIKGSIKFSERLEAAAQIVSKLAKFIANHQPGPDDTGGEGTPDAIPGDAKLAPPRSLGDFEAEICDTLPRWRDIGCKLDAMSSALKIFSDRLGRLWVDVNRFDQDENLHTRPALPTEANGVRLSCDSLMKVLRYFPVPPGRRMKEEIKLRRRMILSHYEHNSAVRFLAELRELPHDYEIDELVAAAAARVTATLRILRFYSGELAAFHPTYREFVREYIIALESPSDPEHASAEHIKAVSKLISDARENDVVAADKLHRVQAFRQLTEELHGLLVGVGADVAAFARQGSLEPDSI